MKSRKIIGVTAILLSLFLVVASFAGCSTKEEVVGEDTKAQEETRETRETRERDVEETDEIDPFGKYDPTLLIESVRLIDPNITFVPGDPDRESFEVNIWARAYKEVLGIEFDYIWTAPSDQYVNRWNLAIASRDLPDMAQVPLDIFRQLVEADMLEDMTEWFDLYASALYRQANEDDGGIAMQSSSVGGRLMGLPLHGTQPDNTAILYVRKDWLNNVGLDVPQTMDEFYEVARAFTYDDPNRSGKDDTYGWAVSNSATAGLGDLAGFFNGFGAYLQTWVLNDVGEVVWGSVQPQAKDALLMMHDMYSEGIMLEDFSVRSFSDVVQDISAEKVGMTFGHFWAPLVGIVDTIVENPEAEWVAAPIPSVAGHLSKAQASATPGRVFIVKKGYEHPEAAVKLLNLGLQLFDDEYETYVGSTKNLHKFRIAPEVLYPWDNLTKHKEIKYAFETGDTSVMRPGTVTVFEQVQKAREGQREHFAMQLVFDEGGAYSIIDYYKDNDRIMVNPYQTVPSENMTEKMPNLNDLVMETYFKIIMGESIDTFDQMVQNWNRMGGIEITAEVNEWRKSIE